MELISQRVARGLPVKAKRRRHGKQSSKSSLLETEGAGAHGSSSSVDWKKFGERIATTKEKAGDLKEIFRDGQVSTLIVPLLNRMTHAEHVLSSGRRSTIGRH